MDFLVKSNNKRLLKYLETLTQDEVSQAGHALSASLSKVLANLEVAFLS